MDVTERDEYSKAEFVRGRPLSDPATEFGRYLRELMRKRGIGGTKGLADILNKDGHIVTQQAISNYVAGKYKASTVFVEALAERLGLTEQERQELAWYFAYGQKRGG